MTFDDPLNDVEADADAVALSLGAEKGLEHLLSHFIIDAASRILYFDYGKFSSGPLLPSGRDLEHPLPLHGVSRIDKKVEEHLLKLRLVPSYCGDALIEVLFHGDLPHALLEEKKHITEKGIQIHPVERHPPPSYEVQEMVGELRRPLRGILDDVCVPGKLALLGEGPFQKGGVPEDSRKQVVEVVGDPSGEHADALHLMLLDLFLAA